MRLFPTRVAALLVLALALPTVVGCASASRSSRGDEVGGLFDDANQYEQGGGTPERYVAPPPPPPAPAYAPGAVTDSVSDDAEYDAPVMRSAPTVDVSEEAYTVQGRAAGAIDKLLDFAGDAIEGELTKPEGSFREARPEPSKPAEPGLPNAGEPAAGKAQGDKPPVESSAAKRLVIYKGSLVVLVPAVEPAVEKLSARANELGGYVENQSGNSGSNNGTLTLRVPAEKFYDLVNELGTYGQVTQKQISASDVTKQVFDIELRLETAEKSRQRLLDLLKSATKMEEILQIENEVRRLTQEIEGMKGELRFLRDQVAFSTLAVTFYSNAPPPNQGPTRTRSRFEWINQVGVENVLYNF